MSADPMQVMPALDRATEAALRASIERFGVLTPVVRDQHGRTLDGHHRERIAAELAVPCDAVVIEVADDDEAREIAVTLNTDRRQLDPQQRREVVAALRGQGHSFRAIGKALGIGKSQAERDASGVPDGTPQPDQVTGRDGKSYPAKRKAPRYEPQDENVLLRSAAEVKARRREERARERAAAAAPPTDACTIADLHELVARGQRFGTIYADPPWQYANQGTRAATGDHYPTMPLADIKALPVAELAADASVLHLWSTASFVPDALEVLAAWGFEYRGLFAWVKPQFGLGNYWRNATELLLLGVRGDVGAFLEHDLRNWIEAPRTEHSAKPAEVRELVQRAWHGPYLELFARERVDGWTCWGDQLASVGESVARAGGGP